MKKLLGILMIAVLISACGIFGGATKIAPTEAPPPTEMPTEIVEPTAEPVDTDTPEPEPTIRTNPSGAFTNHRRSDHHS